MRVASLLGHTAEYPAAFRSELEELARRVLPPRTLSEIEDCLGIPFAFLRGPLEFSEVEKRDGDSGILLSGGLLARHSDERCGEVLRTGYEKHPNRDLIYVINRSGKVAIEDHFALRRRVANKSYGHRIFYKADELVSRSVINLGTKEVGIRFPLNASHFSGWDHLSRCHDVTIIGAHGSDWEKILRSVKKWRFEACTGLELEGCFDFDFAVINELFPRLTYVIIDDCHNLAIEGLSACQNLEQMEFRNILRPIEISDAGGCLTEVIFTNCGHHRVSKKLTDRGLKFELRYQSV